MNIKEQLIGTFEPALLALILVWNIAIVVGFMHPETNRDPNGVVEIYSLAAIDDSRTGV